MHDLSSLRFFCVGVELNSRELRDERMNRSMDQIKCVGLCFAAGVIYVTPTCSKVRVDTPEAPAIIAGWQHAGGKV